MNSTPPSYSRLEILKMFYDGSFQTNESIQFTIASMLAPDELNTAMKKDFDAIASATKQELFKLFSAESFPTAANYASWIDTLLNLKDDYQQEAEELKTKSELKARFAPESFPTVADYHSLINSMVNWQDDKKVWDKELD